MAAETAASLVHIDTRLLALVSERNLKVITLLELSAVEVATLRLDFDPIGAVLNVVHESVCVEILVPEFVIVLLTELTTFICL